MARTIWPDGTLPAWGIPLQFAGREDLTREQIEALWGAGVCMDDWDYIIIGPASILKRPCWYVADDPDADDEWGPTSHYVAALLNGPCYDKWYRVELDGLPVAVGVAYH